MLTLRTLLTSVSIYIVSIGIPGSGLTVLIPERFLFQSGILRIFKLAKQQDYDITRNHESNPCNLSTENKQMLSHLAMLVSKEHLLYSEKYMIN